MGMEVVKQNKSLQHWVDRNIIFLADLQNDEAQLCYEEFLRSKIFSVTHKEYQTATSAIPSGILQLMKCHSERQELSHIVDFIILFLTLKY